MRRLRILMVTAEFAPIAKAGGLADMVAGLAGALAARGHDVRVLLPRYALPTMPTAVLAAGTGTFTSPVRLGAGHPAVELRATHVGPCTVYLVDAPGMVEAGSIYGGGAAELRRFALLAHAITPLVAATGFVPDIVHCHDWHTAVAPLLLAGPAGAALHGSGARTVLTLHNVGYQGHFDRAAIDDLGLGAVRPMLEDLAQRPGQLSYLAAGIARADALTTVSPTHAREILTPEQGHGLDGALRARADRLTGILNGIDDVLWNPATDPALPARFTAGELGGKRACRDTLAAACGLAVEATPLLGCVARLATQKGLDLLLAALPGLLETGRLRAIVLGTGDVALAEAFTRLASRFSGRFAFAARHDEAFARLIYAGADMFVVPSRYEPCGLTQMYALRYGAVPVVRATGGLADTVTHFDPASGTGNGCVFRDADPEAVRWGIEQALGWHADPTSWSRVVANGMGADFSWRHQAPAYEAVYAGVL